MINELIRAGLRVMTKYRPAARRERWRGRGGGVAIVVSGRVSGRPLGAVRTVDVVANHPTMRTPDGRWSVEVITTRGGQSFRVKRLDRLPAPGSSRLPSPGTLVATIAEVRHILGDDFDQLVEVRDRRFDGGR